MQLVNFCLHIQYLVLDIPGYQPISTPKAFQTGDPPDYFAIFCLSSLLTSEGATLMLIAFAMLQKRHRALTPRAPGFSFNKTRALQRSES